jgi:NADH-quinone oxidoreductase subunit N
MTLLSFAILILVERDTTAEIPSFDGLAKRAPFLAFAMLVAMASLAGLPFTAGFFGKFFIFAGAVAHQQTALVIVGIITVACGFYYYLKVVRAMYWPASDGIQRTADHHPIHTSILSRAIMILLIVATIFFGLYPQPILEAIKPQRADATIRSASAH